MNGIFNLNIAYDLFSLLHEKYFNFCYKDLPDKNLVITLFLYVSFIDFSK